MGSLFTKFVAIEAVGRRIILAVSQDMYLVETFRTNFQHKHIVLVPLYVNMSQSNKVVTENPKNLEDTPILFSKETQHVLWYLDESLIELTERISADLDEGALGVAFYFESKWWIGHVSKNMRNEIDKGAYFSVTLKTRDDDEFPARFLDLPDGYKLETASLIERLHAESAQTEHTVQQSGTASDTENKVDTFKNQIKIDRKKESEREMSNSAREGDEDSERKATQV